MIFYLIKQNLAVGVLHLVRDSWCVGCSGTHPRAHVAVAVTGGDSFYVAIVSQISEPGLSVLRWNQQQAITEFRYQVAQALLRNRAADGSFYPRQREIAQYASTADMPSRLPEPDALGLYSQGPDRYLFLDSQYFKVDRAGTHEPWRIRHPSLEDAYAPVLVSNGAGAWRHEWEKPLTWDGQKPFWRLGPLARSLSPDAIEQIQTISGVTPGILRRVHVRNERPPVLLLETIVAGCSRRTPGSTGGRGRSAPRLRRQRPCCSSH